MRQQMHWIWVYHIKHRVSRWSERLTVWIAWHLPRILVMWCSVRLAAHATMGEWGNTDPSELSVMDALERWTSP